MFLLDIQRDQVAAVAAAIAARHRIRARRRRRCVPVLRARVVGVAGREVKLENYEDVRGRGSLAPRIHHHLSRRRSSATSGSSPAQMWDADAVGRAPKCRSRRFISERSGSTSATRCASTCSAGRVGARSRASGTSSGRTAAPAASCSCSGRACSRRRRTASSASCAGRSDLRRARALQTALVARLPERVGDRRPRDPRRDQGGGRQRHAGGHRGRHAGRGQRPADPDRRGGDDEVPPRLRGRDLQDARRHPAA